MALLRDFGIAPGKTAGLGGSRGIPGAFHCFSGSVETAEELVAMGFYLGFDGPITFKNARKAPDVIRKIPRDRILIETDSPYLAPVPYRGQRNEPAYVLQVARQLPCLGVHPREAAQRTWENACRFLESAARKRTDFYSKPLSASARRSHESETLAKCHELLVDNPCLISIFLLAACYGRLFKGSLAQLGEHLPYKQGVTGSSPVTPPKHTAQ